MLRDPWSVSCLGWEWGPMEEVYSLPYRVSYYGLMGSSPKCIKFFKPQLPFCSPYLIGLFLRLI